MNTNFIHRVLLVVFLVCVGTAVQADNIPITGIPPMSTIAGGPFDSIDLANLNVHFSIPVFARAGRGIPFAYSISYDSSVWIPVPGGTWTPVPNWGWRTPIEAVTGYVSAVRVIEDCTFGLSNYSDFIYHDAGGTPHPLDYFYDLCDGIVIGTGRAKDNSGYLITGFNYGTHSATTFSRSGVLITSPFLLNSDGAATGSGNLTDPNGNEISISTSGVITDTLGTPLTINGNPPTYPNCSNTVTYNYPAPGGTATVTVSYVTKTVQTNFAVSGIREFAPTNECLVNRVTLPDASYYQFTYELTNGSGNNVTGRIASVRLPTGGVINYSYAGTGCGNDSNCMMADGGPSAMTRILGSGQWSYTRAIQPGQQLKQTTTTVVDPANNETDLNFSGIYETMRTVYQGRRSAVLDYSYICYNGNINDSTCPSAVVGSPINSRGHNDHANQITFGAPYSNIWDYYDTHGNLTQETDNTFASPPTLIRVVNNTYYGCTSAQICNELASDQVTDGSGTSKSYTTYAYDQGGNTHGKVTTVNRSSSGLTSGPFLSQRYSYNSNGVLTTTTDPKGTVTTYNTSGYSCNGAFPNDVSSGGLNSVFFYNCTGGVVTQAEDPNNAVTTTSYSFPHPDPYFWRPSSTADQLGLITYYNYYGVNNSGGSVVTVPGQTESVWNYSGVDLDLLITPDSFGRPLLSQQRNPQSTWNTVQNFYDTSGRIQYISLPFTTSAGPGGASQGGISAIGYTYDNLGRTTYVATCNGDDCNGANTTYSYNLNDVKITSGPGQTFSEQLEYDSLGRLTSVCEISSSLSGVGACAQNTAQTGYRTTYTYDPLGDLTQVTQGIQTRSYSYDGLGRRIAENNPESGNTTYTFDSLAANYCAVGAYSSPGDLVAKADAIGNHVCYYYDALHRLTDVGNNMQSPSNLCHRFRYDNSTGVKGTRPVGITPAYPFGRMVEAATDNCGAQGDPLVTDEWFGYTKRGEPTDQWTSTPNSGGWYHVQQSYYGNGAAYTLQGFKGTGTSSPFSDLFIYSLDSEGRPYSVADGGTNIWASTTYNTANQPLTVQQSAGGGETFSYGGSIGDTTYGKVMKGWQSTAGSRQQTGTLTWNDNGTLNALAITDPFNSANAQTCYYSYDDLVRLSANSCQGSPGIAESYSYDRYGNISTNDSRGSYYSFPATYNTSNNRITYPAYYYDANGNITGDNQFNLFQYDVYNRPINVNDAPVVFDALGRAVELYNTNGYTQHVYAPSGIKFAYMSGQTLQKYLVPMVAGMQSVHNSDGTSYFAHADWLGSSRLAVTSTGTVRYDRAYTPFGQAYAELNNDPTNRSFTGQNEDTSSGIYDFELRQESSIQGRWFVPDPAGLGAVDTTSPQSLNRYAYVGNNPVSNVDPLGLDDGDDDGGDDVFGDSPDDGQQQGTCSSPPCSFDGPPLVYPPTLIDPPQFDPNPIQLPPNQDQQEDPSFESQGNFLAAYLFGPEGNKYWTPAANVVTGLGYTTIGIVGGVVGATEIAGASTTIGAVARGWYYGLKGPSGLVLGTFAAKYSINGLSFVDAAKAIGANYLNASPEVYNYYLEAGEWEMLDNAFLDASYFRGQQFYLNTDPAVATDAVSWAAELQHMTEMGIDANNLPWVLLP